MVLLIIYVSILYMFYNITYTIDKQFLYIKIGFFRYKPICIEDIKKVSRSVNYYSSPAASFDRIEITYNKFDEVMISPNNPMEFIKDLQKINSNIIHSSNK